MASVRAVQNASRLREGANTAARPREFRAAARLEALQQPLDVVELELRPARLAEAAAQLFQNAARALRVDLAGHLEVRVVVIAAPAQRPAERIGVLLRPRTAAARL